MIYSPVGVTEPIRQGDVFRDVPMVDLRLSALSVIGLDDELRQTTWRDILAGRGGSGAVTAVLPLRPVTGMVITQNCDSARGQFLSPCQVGDYLEAFSLKEPPKNPKKWKSLIVEKARTNSRFFYLPADETFGLRTRQAADFRVVFSMPRVDLESLRDRRVAKLSTHAAEHFREALAHFFRRYAYNEWYPLDPEEFQSYADDCGEKIEPYPGQLKGA